MRSFFAKYNIRKFNLLSKTDIVKLLGLVPSKVSISIFVSSYKSVTERNKERIILPKRHLFVQSQQLKYQKKFCHFLKVNNRKSRAKLKTSPVVDKFEQILHSFLIISLLALN